MNILIIHHLEPIWKAGYAIHNTSFENELSKVAEYLSCHSFDKVILTRFEETKMEPEYYSEIMDYVSQVHDYAYGWEMDMEIHGEGYSLIEGGNHSNAVMVTPWLTELKGHKISLCGAFDGECLEDMEIALKHCQIDFSRVEKLIVG